MPAVSLPNAIAVLIGLAASPGLLMLSSPQPQVLKIDGTSRVSIHVGKAGAFGFAGHVHEVVAPVTGTVTLDPSDLGRSVVLVEFDSAALKVTGQGEPAQDVPDVQRIMLSDQVLDVHRYPKIVFRSRRVTTGARAGDSQGLSVEGDLSLHGVTKPCTVPVRVRLSQGALTAEGSTTIKQSDFGIQPVTAAGGTVRVKDELEISFKVHAAR